MKTGMSLWRTWRALRGGGPRADRDRGGFGVLGTSTRWEGEVWLRGDVVVPAGGILEILPGTRVHVAASACWKHDYQRPGDRGQWLSSPEELCVLVVYGVLRVLGTPEQPVVFLPEGKTWGGVVLLERSEAAVEGARLTRAHRAGIAAYDRVRLRLRASHIAHSPAGVTAGGFSAVSAVETRWSENRLGLLAFDFARARAERCWFVQNEWGARADDGAGLELEGCSLRSQARPALLAEGRARVVGVENGFEGNAAPAVHVQENASGFLRDNRLFHNGAAVRVSARGRLVSEDDKVGPNEGEGFSAEDDASLTLRRAFVHSHAAGPAVRADQSARVRLSDSRFFGNGVAALGLGGSRWKARRCVFQGNTDAAMRFQGRALAEALSCRFERNRAGACFEAGSRGVVEAGRFLEHDSRALLVKDEAAVSLSRNLFRENAVGCEAEGRARLGSREDKWTGQRIHGILARHAADVSVARGDFEGNGGSGCQVLDEGRLRVRRSRFLSNEVGIGLSERASARVEGNLLQSHRREGISTASLGEVRVRGNTFVQNQTGVGHYGPDRARVSRNRFWHSREAAGVFSGEAAALWEKNRCWESGRAVWCRDRSRPILTKNRFAGSRRTAVLCEDGSKPELRGNTFAGDPAAGFPPRTPRPMERAAPPGPRSD